MNVDSLTSVAPAASLGAEGVTGGTVRGAAASAESPAAFTAMLGEMATNAIGVLKGAEATAISGVHGQASVQQVVEAVMSAEQTLQGALAVRDKVVAAYLELSRMQI